MRLQPCGDRNNGRHQVGPVRITATSSGWFYGRLIMWWYMNELELRNGEYNGTAFTTTYGESGFFCWPSVTDISVVVKIANPKTQPASDC